MVVRFAVCAAFASTLALVLVWSAVTKPGAATVRVQPALASGNLTQRVAVVTPSPFPTATRQPATPVPTATPTTAQTATPIPVEPTPAPTEEPAPTETVEVVEDIEDVEPIDAPTEEIPSDPIVADEPEPQAAEDREPLGYEPELDAAWDAAIVTPGGGLMGVLTATANIRSAPAVGAEVLAETYAGHLVAVYGLVVGDWVGASDIWYVVGPEEYVAAELVAPFVAPSPDASFDGHWVDVNLSTGYAVAYAGDVPVYAAITMVGKPGFETPVGVHTIFERVASETLDSATVGIPEGNPEYYYIEDVAYTQYFADGGFALHTNYWDPAWAFGGATSHGCVNLLERDAAWFWEFLDYGSVVYVHY